MASGRCTSSSPAWASPPRRSPPVAARPRRSAPSANVPRARRARDAGDSAACPNTASYIVGASRPAHARPQPPAARRKALPLDPSGSLTPHPRGLLERSLPLRRRGLGGRGIEAGPGPGWCPCFPPGGRQISWAPRCRLTHSVGVDAPKAQSAWKHEITSAEAGRNEIKTPFSPLSSVSPEKLAAEEGARNRRAEQASGAAAVAAVAGGRAPARFCNDARAGRPPQLPLSCYHMTAARRLGVSLKRSEKLLPGSPLVHTSSAGRGGARTLRKRSVCRIALSKHRAGNSSPSQGHSLLPLPLPIPFAVP